MQLEPVEKHIQEIQRKRARLFMQSLDFINNYHNNSRNYYLVMMLVSLLAIGAGISLMFTFKTDIFVKLSLFFSTTSLALAMINYLNSLEKSSEKIGKIFSHLDLKYKQEINILKNFYTGQIDEKMVRNFYLNADIGIEEKYFNNGVAAMSRWINLILFFLAVIMILFNFV